MSKLTGVLLFVAGAAIGSVATYFVTKKKIEDRTDAEIKAMKAHYKKKYEEPKELVINQELKKLVLYPVGLALGTYIIAQNEEGVYMIDQHNIDYNS